MPTTVRRNYVPKVLKEIGWDRERFLREAYYHKGIARNTALKFFEPDIDVDVDTLEKICSLLNRPLHQVFDIVVT